MKLLKKYRFIFQAYTIIGCVPVLAAQTTELKLIFISIQIVSGIIWGLSYIKTNN